MYSNTDQSGAIMADKSDNGNNISDKNEAVCAPINLLTHALRLDWPL